MPRPSATSLIDRVDRRNRPIGFVSRGSALGEGANFRTVHVFVFDSEGQLLIQQLSASRDRHGMLWGSSVAGYLFAGESYRDGAIRRLREELGLTTSIRWRGMMPVDDENSRKFVGLYSTVANNPSIHEPDEISSLQWRTIPQLVADVGRSPSQFTPTFRDLLSFYVRSFGDD